MQTFNVDIQLTDSQVAYLHIEAHQRGVGFYDILGDIMNSVVANLGDELEAKVGSRALDAVFAYGLSRPEQITNVLEHTAKKNRHIKLVT